MKYKLIARSGDAKNYKNDVILAGHECDLVTFSYFETESLVDWAVRKINEAPNFPWIIADPKLALALYEDVTLNFPRARVLLNKFPLEGYNMFVVGDSETADAYNIRAKKAKIKGNKSTLNTFVGLVIPASNDRDIIQAGFVVGKGETYDWFKYLSKA